jgi:flagellar motor switch/type III secretory pathway protein FliN
MSSSPNSSSSSEAARLALESLAWVMDVPCPVEFVLGTTTVKVRECVKFAPNSIVRLKQAAGADLEVRVAGVPVAAGEVVIVDDAVSLRLSKILPPLGTDAA